MTENSNKALRPRIAIGFFGITRSLKWTLPSIQKNIIAPARELGETRLFAHLYQQEHINNPRTGEDQSLDPNEYQLLGCDEVELEKPGNCLAEANYEWVLSHGDAFHDDGKSLANLIHQLHSLQQVGRMIAAWKPDILVMTRPDLMYHDNFYQVLKDQLKSPSNSLTIPNWQWFGGYNDRFAVCGPVAGFAYANRKDLIKNYLNKTGGPLPAERFLRFNLHKGRISVKTCSLRASRTRANGTAVDEDFNAASLGKYIKRALTKYFV
jgi:hypothetical protein